VTEARAEPDVRAAAAPASPALRFAHVAFVRLGVLPFLLLIAIVAFTLLSDNFLTQRNLLNVARQSTYLIMVSMGQMFALLTGGFDLSVGTTLAITSVVGATAMAAAYVAMPDAVVLAIAIGLLAGFAAGLSIGIVNGIGVALFNVSPFMMTLGMASIGFGIALYMTGGVPVYGMPSAFGDVFGFGSWLGIPAPVYFSVALILLLYLLVNWTRLGRYFYAVGGNIKAARLSGINTRLTLFTAYVLCGGMASISGLLLTARLETGEANIGASMPLESIAACVIAGVSLRGGVGRVENAVLGALFIGLIQNGMNLARIESYLQTVVIGILLILAVVADQLRLRYLTGARE
jgi:ribose/xylose/arabinose/galactoside ABC-type transport system permease subunit